MPYIIVLLALLTSCSMYKTNFDCPPGEGIPCTPVTTLEKMIIESPCGEDQFLGCVPKLVDMQKDPTCKCTPPIEPSAPFQRRIWIAPKGCEQPAYIYFNEDLECGDR
jgi:hypothetical protein